MEIQRLLHRLDDPADNRRDPYHGVEGARILGTRSRHHNTALNIWERYSRAKCEETAAEDGNKTRQPATDISALDVTRRLFEKNEFTYPIVIRTEDIAVLRKIVDNTLTDEERQLHAKQIDFLNKVLGLLDELLRGEQTAETCSEIASAFRVASWRALTKEGKSHDDLNLCLCGGGGDD